MQESPRTQLLSEFSKHFDVIDDRLTLFSVANDLTLVKNVARRPCRELHKSGNPTKIVGLYFDAVWTEANDNDKLLYKIVLASYYRSESNQQFVRRKIMVGALPFAKLEQNLEALLNQGVEELSKWEKPPTALSLSLPVLSPAESFEHEGWAKSPAHRS